MDGMADGEFSETYVDDQSENDHFSPNENPPSAEEYCSDAQDAVIQWQENEEGAGEFFNGEPVAEEDEEPQEQEAPPNNILYQTLLQHNDHQQFMFTHPELQTQPVTPANQAQMFRFIAATTPYLISCDPNLQMSSMAAWHFDQYQMYANYMDKAVQDGGLNNHLETIETRMGNTETTRQSWTPGNDPLPEFLTDKEIEDRILSHDELKNKYFDPMKRAYLAMETSSAEEKKVSTRKRVPGTGGFRAPARLPAASTSGGDRHAHDSQRLMDSYDMDIVGSKSEMGKASRVPKVDSVRHDIKNRNEVRETSPKLSPPKFRTGREQLLIESANVSKPGFALDNCAIRPVTSGFMNHDADQGRCAQKRVPKQKSVGHVAEPMVIDERLKHLDQQLVERIQNEILDKSPPVSFDDIAGLHSVKEALEQIIIWPMQNPGLFTGIRSPAKGVLLFGPPGTGKTLIGKCAATQSKATFFSISASSLTSKWIGEGEKMVKTLFEVARTKLPAIIFIDEVDSLLGQRSADEHDSSRRMKTEFLVSLDGVATGKDERLLVIGATNRPQEIDEAARRRFVKRLYVPLPDKDARVQIVSRKLADNDHSISDIEFQTIGDRTEGFSGADMANLCQEAAMNSVKILMMERKKAPNDYVVDSKAPTITINHFDQALKFSSASVAVAEIQSYIDWNKRFGTGLKP